VKGRQGRIARAWLLLAVTLAGVLGSGCRAEPWTLWQQYAAKYVDSQGRVIDKQGGDRTTSEGQAYAMFFALVANDRPAFDKLLQWTQDNLAHGDLTQRLPAWSWGRTPDGQWTVLDANSASDADLWMCYSLLEAGRLWKEPKYAQLGRMMAARIAVQDVVFLPEFGPVLLPGPSGFHPTWNAWVVNPSYTPLPLLARLAQELPDGPWASMLAEQPLLLQATSVNGFAMDWAQYTVNAGWKPVALPGQKDAVAMGSYDAIRVYLWAGMTDPATPGAKACLGAVQGMATYLKTQLLPPAKVDDKGVVINADGPVGFSAAVVPYLQALGMEQQAGLQLDRVGATKDTATGLFGREQVYYDQNLALFALGWKEGRFHFDRQGGLSVQW
jgi:endoglucanase